MPNIEKICQEIERRKEQAKEHYNEPYSIGRCDAFAEMLNFINSLEEKSEILKDLDKAAEEYTNKEFPDESAVGQWGTGDYEPPVDMEYPREIAKDSFIAGAEWQAKQLLKGSPPPEHTILFQKGVEEGRRLEKDEHILTWEDIRRIVKIADDLLDDPKARMAFNNHNEEYYYNKVLEEYYDR